MADPLVHRYSHNSSTVSLNDSSLGSSPYGGEDLPVVQRWDGIAREATDWNSLRRDPEIFFPGGNCFVYLFEQGASRRGPSFRISFQLLVQASCQPLVEQSLASSLPTPTYHAGPPMTPSTRYEAASAIRHSYCSLHLDAPYDYINQEAFKYHITTRNFFAWLVGAPLVGADPVSALLELKVRMDMWRDRGADNFGALYLYVREQSYGDFEDIEIQMSSQLDGEPIPSAARSFSYRETKQSSETKESDRGRTRKKSIGQSIRDGAKSLKRKLSRSRPRFKREDSDVPPTPQRSSTLLDRLAPEVPHAHAASPTFKPLLLSDLPPPRLRPVSVVSSVHTTGSSKPAWAVLPDLNTAHVPRPALVTNPSRPQSFKNYGEAVRPYVGAAPSRLSYDGSRQSSGSRGRPDSTPVSYSSQPRRLSKTRPQSSGHTGQRQSFSEHQGRPTPVDFRPLRDTANLSRPSSFYENRQSLPNNLKMNQRASTDLGPRAPTESLWPSRPGKDLRGSHGPSQQIPSRSRAATSHSSVTISRPSSTSGRQDSALSHGTRPSTDIDRNNSPLVTILGPQRPTSRAREFISSITRRGSRPPSSHGDDRARAEEAVQPERVPRHPKADSQTDPRPSDTDNAMPRQPQQPQIAIERDAMSPLDISVHHRDLAKSPGIVSRPSHDEALPAAKNKSAAPRSHLANEVHGDGHEHAKDLPITPQDPAHHHTSQRRESLVGRVKRRLSWAIAGPLNPSPEFLAQQTRNAPSPIPPLDQEAAAKVIEAKSVAPQLAISLPLIRSNSPFLPLLVTTDLPSPRMTAAGTAESMLQQSRQRGLYASPTSATSESTPLQIETEMHGALNEPVESKGKQIIRSGPIQSPLAMHPVNLGDLTKPHIPVSSSAVDVSLPSLRSSNCGGCGKKRRPKSFAAGASGSFSATTTPVHTHCREELPFSQAESSKSANVEGWQRRPAFAARSATTDVAPSSVVTAANRMGPHTSESKLPTNPKRWSWHEGADAERAFHAHNAEGVWLKTSRQGSRRKSFTQESVRTDPAATNALTDEVATSNDHISDGQTTTNRLSSVSVPGLDTTRSNTASMTEFSPVTPRNSGIAPFNTDRNISLISVVTQGGGPETPVISRDASYVFKKASKELVGGELEGDTPKQQQRHTELEGSAVSLEKLQAVGAAASALAMGIGGIDADVMDRMLSDVSDASSRYSQEEGDENQGKEEKERPLEMRLIRNGKEVLQNKRLAQKENTDGSIITATRSDGVRNESMMPPLAGKTLEGAAKQIIIAELQA